MLVALFRKNKGGSEVIGFSLIATSLYGSWYWLCFVIFLAVLVRVEGLGCVVWCVGIWWHRGWMCNNVKYRGKIWCMEWNVTTNPNINKYGWGDSIGKGRILMDFIIEVLFDSNLTLPLSFSQEVWPDPTPYAKEKIEHKHTSNKEKSDHGNGIASKLLGGRQKNEKQGYLLGLLPPPNKTVPLQIVQWQQRRDKWEVIDPSNNKHNPM